MPVAKPHLNLVAVPTPRENIKVIRRALLTCGAVREYFCTFQGMWFDPVTERGVGVCAMVINDGIMLVEATLDGVPFDPEEILTEAEFTQINEILTERQVQGEKCSPR